MTDNELIDKMEGKDAEKAKLQATHTAELEGVFRQFNDSQIEHIDGFVKFIMTESDYQSLKSKYVEVKLLN